jgi:hypothetical protein
VIGDVEPVPEGKNTLGKEFEVAKKVAMRDHRPEVFDTNILALREHAGGAESARLYISKMADRYIVNAGEDAVGKVAGCRQVPEIEKPFASGAYSKRIVGRGDVVEVDPWLGHICLPTSISPHSDLAQDQRWGSSNHVSVFSGVLGKSEATMQNANCIAVFCGIMV